MEERKSQNRKPGYRGFASHDSLQKQNSYSPLREVLNHMGGQIIKRHKALTKVTKGRKAESLQG